MQATRVTVVLLLLVSAALMLIVTVGGWRCSRAPGSSRSATSSSTSCWRSHRALEPGRAALAAALAALLLVFALVGAPFWFDRNKTGFAQPTINAGLLGTVTLLIVPVQMLLIAFAMRGFPRAGTSSWSAPRRCPAGTLRRHAPAPPGLSDCGARP